MRIASWNVNSIRARVDRVDAWLVRNNIDIIALQETKAKDEQFPWEIFERAGYEVAHCGANQWNGVALASRVGMKEVERNFPYQPIYGEGINPEPRAISALCAGVRIWSLYVPHGRGIDDPHMAYKLEWLRALHKNAHTWLKDTSYLALAGDWNIIPTDQDVWDATTFEGGTHLSPPERAAFQQFLDLGFSDAGRVYYPEPKTYTYWDYKNLSFPKNKGMRIDFILTSPLLTKNITTAWVDRDERKGVGASDHAPVVIETRDF